MYWYMSIMWLNDWCNWTQKFSDPCERKKQQERKSGGAAPASASCCHSLCHRCRERELIGSLAWITTPWPHDGLYPEGVHWALCQGGKCHNNKAAVHLEGYYCRSQHAASSYIDQGTTFTHRWCCCCAGQRNSSIAWCTWCEMKCCSCSADCQMDKICMCLPYWQKCGWLSWLSYIGWVNEHNNWSWIICLIFCMWLDKCSTQHSVFKFFSRQSWQVFRLQGHGRTEKEAYCLVSWNVVVQHWLLFYSLKIWCDSFSFSSFLA